MDIDETSVFATSQQTSQDIPHQVGEAITPAPQKQWSKDDKNRPSMTAGGVVLDVINWGILGGVINGALSIYMADKAGHGSLQPLVNKWTKILQTKYPDLEHEVVRHRVMMGMLCSGGFAPLPIIKYLEDHKLDLTHKLDDIIYGKDKTEEQQKKVDDYYGYLHDVESPQTWGSVMGSRVVMLGTLVAVDEAILKKGNLLNKALTKNNKVNRCLKNNNILKEGAKYSWEGLTPKINRVSIKWADAAKKPLNIGDRISRKLEGTFLENNVGAFFKNKLKGEASAKFFKNYSDELDASAKGLKVKSNILGEQYDLPKDGERFKDLIQVNNVEWAYEGVTTAIAYVASRWLAPIFAKGSRSEMGHSFTYEEKQERHKALEKTGSAVIEKPKEAISNYPSTKVAGESQLTPEMMTERGNEQAAELY